MVILDNLSISAGEFQLNEICMEIPKGQCAVLQGKSGSGKTTIMEAICGLREVLSGRIEIASCDITHAAPTVRNVGLVPQDNVLFQTMSVREQIGYSLTLRKWKKTDILERVSQLSKSLKIEYLLDRKPLGLSGGEAKRVAIARAMAASPDLLCLDESFTGLDDETREEVMQVVKAAIQKEGVTTLLITHQHEEAKFMADVSYVIQDGLVVVN